MSPALCTQVDGLESHDGTLGATVRGDPNYLINADINLNSNHSGWLMSVIGDEWVRGDRAQLLFNHYASVPGQSRESKALNPPVQAAVLPLYCTSFSRDLILCLSWPNTLFPTRP